MSATHILYVICGLGFWMVRSFRRIGRSQFCSFSRYANKNIFLRSLIWVSFELAWLNGRLTKESLESALDDTVKLTTMVVFLLVGSTAFTLVFKGFYGDLWIEDLLVNLPGGVWGLIIISQIVIFILGFFIDFFEIAFILLPLLVPAAKALGIDLVWFAVLIAMNLQTSFLTPPFGFSLFYLRGVAPEEVSTAQIYRGAIPFIVIQMVALFSVALFPELVTWILTE